MTPRLLPVHPKFETATEREVWEVLRTELGPDDVLMANLRLSDEVKDHEADIMAIIAGAGVVVDWWSLRCLLLFLYQAPSPTFLILTP